MAGLKYKDNRGFTLVETLIYIALLALIFGGALLSVYELLAGSSKNTQKAIIEGEANFLLRKIEWALTGAELIVAPAEGGSGPILTLVNDGKAVGFDLADDNLRITKGAEPLPLNNGRVIVSDLVFEHLPAVGDKPAAVRASFNIQTLDDLESESYQTLKYLR